MGYPTISDCPKCKSGAEVAIYEYENGWRHVECTKCNRLGPGEGNIRQAINSWNASVLREIEREACAQLVEKMIPDRKRPDERVVLAIAANAIRRGRHLTSAEQLRNLADSMTQADRENGTVENAEAAAIIRRMAEGAVQ
jgi:Zn ribbon nucleic-acid-binding protein